MTRKRLLHLTAAATAAFLALLAPWSAVQAIDFDEVRDFQDVFVLSAEAPARDRIELRWAIEDGFYLYNNKFLQVRADTEGVVLGELRVPPGERGFDELLGQEVEKYHGELRVTLPLESVAPGVETVRLNVRAQGCMEDVLCYPPTAQRVEVRLPQGGQASPLQAPGGLADNPLLGDDESPALSAGEAFRFESIGLDAGTALLRFTAQPGYYLYVDRFAFRVSGADGFVIAAADLPEGVIKDDPEFGPVPVYYDQVEIPLRFNRPAGPAQDITVEADFQGCRDGDICYPPMSRAVTFSMPAAPEAIGAVRDDALTDTPPAAAPPVSDQDRLARLLTSSPWQAVLAFFVAGLLLAFTPCVLPMVPILSGIIIGQGDRLTPLRAFWLSLVYVLAMAVTYTVAGVLAGLFGQNLQAAFQNPWIISGFVVIFVLLALSMFGFYELQLPSRLQTRLAEASNRQRGGQLWGVAVMGFLSALIVGPCVAPPLMAALIVIGSSGDAMLGGAALFALAMGMGVPLILFGVSAGKLVPRAGRWMDAVKAVFGVAMLGLSIWMLERILPGAVIMLLWGALAIGCAIYLGALERIEPGASGWRRLWKALGVMLLVLGVLEFIGAAAGGDDWQRPLAGLGTAAPGAGAAHEEVAFERIKSADDLDRELAGAGQVAMLDFYADWCIECKRMERNTFPEPTVAALMDRMRLLQADVTANDDVDQALMRRFGVIGPPAILFFDRAGRELEAYRLVGYFDPETFARHLEAVLEAR